MSGPKLRTDVVDVYVFRRSAGAELLQLRRSRAPFVGAWHPVMGHIENGERAIETALRELHEEIGLARAGLVALYQLEQTFPFFLAERDEIMLSPRFAAEVDGSFEPRLNGEHDAHRWVPIADAPDRFVWPGQQHAIDELARFILPGGEKAEALRLLL
ncbi:MAG: NUDIX domain-containing protein [Planctomycetota bacterium]